MQDRGGGKEGLKFQSTGGEFVSGPRIIESPGQ